MENEFIKSILYSDLSACNDTESFLQSAMWGRFKSFFGWQAKTFILDWLDGSSGSLLVLCRRLCPGFSFAYVPWGPELPANFPDDPCQKARATREIACTLRPYLHGIAFIRFDPPWYSAGKEIPAPVLGKPFIRSHADVQAPHSVIIDLKQSQDSILSDMKSQWRYNRRFTLKKGVTISCPGDNGLEEFYKLMKMTSKRKAIAIHDVNYYEKLFLHCREYFSKEKKAGGLHLYIAEHEGDSIAAIVVLFWGEKAYYLYAATSDIKRHLMPSFALQIQAIIDAKAAGCLEYDLYGIPPNEDPHHPMAGLYRFKTGFGGQIIHRPGSWDYIYLPFRAYIFRAAEKIRKDFRDYKKIKSRKPV
jgi:lipid II:glycine glycyltransferase (peptidoglycan interpeptide bridge formation enzyme)